MFNKILLCSKNLKFKDEIQELVVGIDYTFRQVGDSKEILALENQYRPAVIIIEAADNKIDLFQAYDTAYRKYNSSRIIVVYNNKLSFDFDQIGGRKQGMRFLQRPFEDELLLNYLLEFAPIEIQVKNLKLNHLNPISLSDIKASDKFKFDLYLYMPKNQKILLYRRKNSALTAGQISSFEKFHVHDLYVRKNEMHMVTDYLAKKLADAYGDRGMSVTERRKKLRGEVKEVFGKFFDTSQFDYSKSRVALETCKQVVGKFITEINPKSDVYAQLLHYTAQSSTQYNHAINVSVFSVLFALALGVDETESISIGALLHDIGISTLPKDLAYKEDSKMTEAEKELYQTHTTAGIKILEDKKNLASDIVKAIIVQHHEHMDGTGYPTRLKKDQIHICARIVQIANMLDKLTCVKPDQMTLSPADALGKMIEGNKPKEICDNDMLVKLRDLVCPPNLNLIDINSVTEIFSHPVQMPANPEAVDMSDTKRRKRKKKPA